MAKNDQPGLGLDVPLRVVGSSGNAQPVRFGVPVPKGRLHGHELHGTLSFGENIVPAQIAVRARWSDQSVRWLLVDAILPAPSTHKDDEPAILRLSSIPSTQRNGLDEPAILRLSSIPSTQRNGLIVQDSDAMLAIDTGLLRFHWNRNSPRLLTCRLTDDEQQLFDSTQPQVLFVDRGGVTHEPRWDELRLLSSGPVRATVQLSGAIPRLRDLRIHARISVFQGSGLVCLDVTIHNAGRARHPGGIWDLGDPGSHLFKSLAVRFSTTQTAETICYALDSTATAEFQPFRDLHVYQDSSGGENWDSANHVNRSGQLSPQFRGYKAKFGDHEIKGERALPSASIGSDSSRLSVALPEFWQQFPSALSLGRQQIEWALFPADAHDLHELQGGEQKTQTAWFEIDRRDAPPPDLRWTFSPCLVTATDDWWDESGCAPRLQCGPRANRSDLETVLAETLHGERSIFANRERVDEYGWRNYGDLFADHEQTYYPGDDALISHYNNQFDMVEGFLLQFVRTGDRRWFELGDALARHVIDIDIYHTQQDRAAYNGGLFWFTDHYLHAHTSTHRTYSRRNRQPGKPYGGGPGAEHNFTSGLLLHYFLTGNEAAREAVIELAEWVIAMDDGHKNVFGVLEDTPTGLATGTGVTGFHGAGRAAGNSINALLDAWLLTGDERYLHFSETLIRRCVHPEDDVAALNLLDVEKRWSYTVFLTSLAKYLDVKAEAQACDAAYAYAQASLVRYATWMLEHELPYFDQEEKLEFPTEAWAAQEFRKANVFRRASAHTEEPLRSRLLEKGNQFGDRAWSDLMRFETRPYVRAVAIVMTEGLADCVFRDVTPPSRPIAPVTKFPARLEFVPQKQALKAALKNPKALVTLCGRLATPARWLRHLEQCRSPTNPAVPTRKQSTSGT